MTDFVLRGDCRHVRWDRPCAPHKKRGKVCESCDEYAPIRHRVLVVKLAATGDVLRTTAFLPAIHATWPAARVTWVTKKGAAGLFQGNPLVDEVLTTDDVATTARLLTETFDVVLCPDADPEACSIAAMARAAERRGFVRDETGQVRALSEGASHWLHMGLSDARKKANRETYQALVADVLGLDRALVTEPILEPSARDLAAAQRFLSQCAFEGAIVGLNTGAGGRWAYKQWTKDNQQRFVRLCVDAGLGVVLLGGPEERERHKELLSANPGRPVFDAGNDNGYGEFAAKLQLCRVVVTSDSLAVHVAAARKTKAIVLFGPTSAAEIELYGRGEKVVPPGMDCLCCYLPSCDIKPHCQARIEPAAVFAAVQRQLAAK